MSEPNPTTNDVSDVDAPSSVPLGELSRARTASTVREGLPPGYRMRADSHYLDHLESRHLGGPEAWLDPNLIQGSLLHDDASLRELVESIRRHGVLQPILVQQCEGEYRVIAGQKRRRAAILAGKTRVPCVIHAVGDDEAYALGVAANIRPAAVHAGPRMPDTTADVARALETLSVYAHLVTGVPSELSKGLTADLIGAEAWRAYCTSKRPESHNTACRRPVGWLHRQTSWRAWPDRFHPNAGCVTSPWKSRWEFPMAVWCWQTSITS